MPQSKQPGRPIKPSLEAQFLSRPIAATEESEAAMINSSADGFDGNRKLADVLRKLDEEIALLVYPERGL